MAICLFSPVWVYAASAEQATQEFCKCNENYLALLEETTEAFVNGDSTRLMELSQDLEVSRSQSRACIAALREKHLNESAEFEAELAAGIGQTCPPPRWDARLPVMGGVGMTPQSDPLGQFMQHMGAPPQ